MAIPLHSLNIFGRPAEGYGFRKRVVMLDYQHTISAMGGFDTASCDIAVRNQGEGQDYLNNYIGCFVQAFADNPYEPIWEGIINRITFNAGGASYSIGLDEMANRVTVKYANDSVTANGTGTLSETAVADLTTSQAIYGIKQASIEFGYNRNGGTAHANGIRDTILAQRAFPQTSITQGQGNEGLVHLELIGIFHTLEWQMFSIITAAATVFNTMITGTLLPGVANGATFFDNTDVSHISANALTITGTQRAQTFWDYMKKMAEGGSSGGDYWNIGITPTNPQTKTRALYYQQANSDTEYTARQADGLRVRNLYGRVVPAWTVKPDRAILVTDVLVGYNSAVSTDPRLVYISNLHYDANTQRVQWFGADDTTERGQFMLNRGFRPYGRAFGERLRWAAN